MKGTAVVASPPSPEQVREAQRFVNSQRRDTRREALRDATRIKALRDFLEWIIS